MQRETGTHLHSTLASQAYKAWLPHPLPPQPALALDLSAQGLLEKTSQRLGQLDNVSSQLANPNLLLYYFVRKEALLSSQIEGTQSSIADLLLSENRQAPGVPEDDVEEVSCYIAALNHAVDRMANGFPLCQRLLNETHTRLLNSVRGSNKQPGQIRQSQNWIGGTHPSNARFVPPPPERLEQHLSQLEQFYHYPQQTMPTLIKAALAHVQFETIHPYLDGNGRLGRMLISLILVNDGLIKQPILFPSLYFKQTRGEYYDHLQSVRTTGNWEAWVNYFLQAIFVAADEALTLAKQLDAIASQHREIALQWGRLSASAIAVLEHLQAHPITSIAQTTEATGINRTTIARVFENLEAHAFVDEISNKQRGKIYRYTEWVEKLGAHAEPL